MSTLPVYRAPMRSRDDDIPVQSSVRHALRHGVVGVGGVLSTVPDDARSAVLRTGLEHDDRAAARLGRFVDVVDGAFVWTRTAVTLFHLGQVTGAWSYDESDEARSVDLVNVRPCDWSAKPVDATLVPGGVRGTFGRGGRNFQQLHTPGVEGETARVWALLNR